MIDELMFEFGATVEDGLTWVRGADLSAGDAVVDLRPTVAGNSVRLEMGAAELQARILPDVYWPRPVSAMARDFLLAEGWTEVSGDLRRSWPAGVGDDVVVKAVEDAVEVLGGDPGDMLLTARPAADWLPACAHAVTFWDWKEPVPFAGFNRACELLLEAGSDSIHFNEVDTGADHYGLVISGAPISEDEAYAAFYLYYWTVPDDGAEMAVVVPADVGGHLRVVYPAREDT